MSVAKQRRAPGLGGGMALGFVAWAALTAAQAAVPPAHPAHLLPERAARPGAPAGGSNAAPLALGVGHTVKGRMQVGGAHVFRLNVPAGWVVQGDFDGRNVVLDLQDEHGAHLRRLSRADAAAQGVMWVASHAPRRLAVQQVGDAPGSFELRISKALEPKPESGGGAPKIDSPRLRSLRDDLASGAGTDAFWADMARKGTPLVEPVSEAESLVTFLWRGTGGNVRLFGSPSGNHDPMRRLGDSDVWWATFRMPNTARLSYRIAPDVPQIQGSPMEQRRVILATAQRDPLNPHVFPDTDDVRIDMYQGASVLTLPQAPPQPWVSRHPKRAVGVLNHHEFESAVLGNRREIWTYRPAVGEPEALLVLFDAHSYLHQVSTPAIIDNLIGEGLIPPTAVVLVGNASPEARGRELPPNESFIRFLDEELMPWVEEQGLAQPASRTVVAGSSYGGLASAYAGLRLPHRFGNVLSLSGSYWWSPPGEIPGWMMRQYAAAPVRDLRFYLDAGRYEASRGGRDGILETSRHLGDVLRAKGYETTQVEHDTGHDYLHWQGSLGCGLVALLDPAAYERGLPACAAGLFPKLP
ncbi:enterochelin esterase domain-containing protein [Pusillimonas noertemannii]|uniref:enterochelin esterase domain-containing protein n=1 Tax=Pusillimonas noertemannii TaxID=305977 RepID=UPI0003109DC3|nr:enterochelin esterase domain-containing protein [Pusillimonas noertemannii]